MTDRRAFLRGAAAAILAGVYPSAFGAVRPARTQGHLIRRTYFGLHMTWPTRAPYSRNMPAVPVGAWRANLPELHWFGLEPRRGAWSFWKFDTAMRLMEAHGIDVLYTLGQTPTWASSNPGKKGPYVYGQNAAPRNLADWENYVRTVAQRYRGRIRHYELWNEPSVREADGDKADFTAAELVAMGESAYRILKEIDPRAKLASPAMVGGEKGIERMDAYLAAGGNRQTDIISFHYYGVPEQIPQYHPALLEVMARHGVANLPVWNTEYGYLIEDPTSPNTHPLIGGAFARVLPDTEAAAWLARSYIIAASLGIERFYWHMWDGRNMGLVTFKGRRINAAGVAHGTVARWLTDRRVGPLQQAGNLVVCPITDNGKPWGWAVWTRDYATQGWTIPTSWRAATMTSLDGRAQKVASDSRIELSASPVLIRASTSDV